MNDLHNKFYDPNLEQDGRFGDGMVLKPQPFKPLFNKRTGNFFSYSYVLAQHNESANTKSDIRWVTEAPKAIQDRIDVLIEMHDKAVDLHEELQDALEDGVKSGIKRVEKSIAAHFTAMDEVIYPVKDRKLVESKESLRFRREQNNELKLDSESIAALTGGAAGSTADTNIALAKLENAEAKIKALEEKLQQESDDTVKVDSDDTVKVDSDEDETAPWASE